MSDQPDGRPDDEDIDARFAEIVRHLRTPGGGQSGQAGPTDRTGPRRARWPGTGASPTDPPNPPPARFQRPPAPRPEPEETARPAAPEPTPAPEPATSDGDGSQPASWREWVDPEVEEHFVPPDPPPLPAGDLHFWGILVGLICGPLILLLAHGIQVLHGSVWTWLGLLLSLGGFVLLVLRSPTDRHDDPSGGAQV
ncbi:hypothetical protein [Ornithinicoccus hortensis]|uniref:DUF308 domain-containing protein n=1 Tax=Ornithinicoccus hortensis TaxID=82346 RepID=A0A542YRA6_9MICO|nr:hypothetical protein [Ornithinicoccus hortensis]TQL50636.1 hypothetical protein FB467_1749 [Ornithinicoccus hortensis]